MISVSKLQSMCVCVNVLIESASKPTFSSMIAIKPVVSLDLDAYFRLVLLLGFDLGSFV